MRHRSDESAMVRARTGSGQIKVLDPANSSDVQPSDAQSSLLQCLKCLRPRQPEVERVMYRGGKAMTADDTHLSWCARVSEQSALDSELHPELQTSISVRLAGYQMRARAENGQHPHDHLVSMIEVQQVRACTYHNSTSRVSNTSGVLLSFPLTPARLECHTCPEWCTARLSRVFNTSRVAMCPLFPAFPRLE